MLPAVQGGGTSWGGRGGTLSDIFWVVKSKNLTRPGPEGTGGFPRLTPHAADPLLSILTSRRGRRITRETREGRREDQKEKSDETERRDSKHKSIQALCEGGVDGVVEGLALKSGAFPLQSAA